MNLDDVRTILAASGCVLEPSAAVRLERYVELLLARNAAVNLVSRRDPEQVWRDHILHSLSVLPLLHPPGKAVYLDVGTGGGLPGIPLAIAMPDARVMLVDSIAKKIRAVDDLVSALGLPNVHCLHGRVEELVRRDALPEHPDLVVARAVAPLADLVRWISPAFSGRDCILLAWKGGDLTLEIRDARKQTPGLDVTEHPIDLAGEPYFLREQKKILHVRFHIP